MALNEAEAARLGVNNGVRLALLVNGHELHLPLRIVEDLAVGLVGLPVGLPGVPAAFAGAIVSNLQEAAQ
ncbi:NADH-quinone oxidoreductase OS=Stutzerimonas stutzeri OX=316 GN=CXK95_15650 PE=3 SV=1 [Stutzerimonas stutzeri]